METKRCKKCGRELPLEAFGVLAKNPDGLRDYCKECNNQQQRENYARRKAKEQGITAKTSMDGGGGVLML